MERDETFKSVKKNMKIEKKSCGKAVHSTNRLGNVTTAFLELKSKF